MKSVNYLFVLTIFLTVGIYITSCNSPAKKTDNENIQENSKEVSESESEFHVKKSATSQEWDDFKKEQELKLNEVEQQIAELRNKMAKKETGQN
ncbi:MAG: hypothetical protein IPF54_14020 [Draconibacterium sp.]|nr:hypothetical protein [Draconibacterium sp.]